MAEQGKTGGKTIEPFKTGDKTRTARQAGVMNEIIKALNTLQNMTVSPQEFGKFIYSDANIILQLDQTLGIPDPPTTGTWFLGAIDGVIQWIDSTNCP